MRVFADPLQTRGEQVGLGLEVARGEQDRGGQLVANREVRDRVEGFAGLDRRGGIGDVGD